MSNRLYNYLKNVLSLRLARATDIASNMLQIEAAFDVVAAEFDRTPRAPSGEGAIGALPPKAVRAGKVAAYNADGDPVAADIASSEAMQAAVQAAYKTAIDRAVVAATAGSICGPVVQANAAAVTLTIGVTTALTFNGKVVATLPAAPTDGAVVCVVPCNSRRDNEVMPAAGQSINGIAGESYIIDAVVTQWFKFIAGAGWWRI